MSLFITYPLTRLPTYLPTYLSACLNTSNSPLHYGNIKHKHFFTPFFFFFLVSYLALRFSSFSVMYYFILYQLNASVMGRMTSS